MRQWMTMAAVAATALVTIAVPPAMAQRGGIEETSVAAIQADMAAGRTSSERLTRAYLARIAAMDRTGPTLRSVISLNPQAVAQARALDAERKAGWLRGALHGVPVLVKDNIETIENATTAGSLALKNNFTRRDAPLVARLRTAGAVILGKTNLSEWANIRSSASMSGWSAVGGLVRNPYALDRSSCGSSSGTGAAIAASLAVAGVGTETDGSVICPAAMNGLVGLKPTIGLVSRTHVVPISHSQDTAGPMARTVRDAAALFSAMMGSDGGDFETRDADRHRRDYAAALDANVVRGLRIGVLRPEMPTDLAVRFEAALAVLKAEGAVLVDVTRPATEGMGAAEFDVLKMELKSHLNAYLATTPISVTTRTLAQVIAFNKANAATEMPLFAQEIFEQAEATGGVSDPRYEAARAKSLGLARGAIDGMLKAGDVRLIVTPSYGAPWLSDPVLGDQFSGPSASALPAISGYPHLTVPMGLIDGLPVGLSFFSTALTDGLLLNAGYAFEQAGRMRVVPAYRPSAEAKPGLAGVR